jgi:hypothetical protein
MYHAIWDARNAGLCPGLTGLTIMNADMEKKLAVHIRESRDSARDFVFHLSDNDLFVRTGRQLIEACQLNISIDLWRQELDLMFTHVKDWCGKKGNHVRTCLCEPRRARLVLHFIPKSDGFDFDLADGIAELDSYLSRNFKNVGLVEAGQIPWIETERFVNPNIFFVIDGEHPVAHDPVGT